MKTLFKSMCALMTTSNMLTWWKKLNWSFFVLFHLCIPVTVTETYQYVATFCQLLSNVYPLFSTCLSLTSRHMPIHSNYCLKTFLNVNKCSLYQMNFRVSVNTLHKNTLIPIPYMQCKYLQSDVYHTRWCINCSLPFLKYMFSTYP